MRRILVALMGLGMFAATLAASAAEPAYPGKERPRVLVLGEPHGYGGGGLAERCLVEAMTDIRFTFAVVPYAGGDGALDVSEIFCADTHLAAQRKAELLRRLGESWDAIVYALRGGHPGVDTEVQQALAAAVRRGEKLIWLAGKLDAQSGFRPPTEALAQILPYAEQGDAVPYTGTDPLAHLGLEEAGVTAANDLPARNGFAPVHAIQGKPLLLYRTFGKGAVLALKTGGSLFPRLANDAVDGEMLWARALERVIRFARDGQVPPAVEVDASEAPAGDGAFSPARKFRLKLAGPQGLRVRVEQDDQRGPTTILAKSVALKPTGVELEATGAPSVQGWARIQAVPLGGAAAPGVALVPLRDPFQAQIETTQQGFAPGFETRVRLALVPPADVAGAVLTWTVRDWARTAVAIRAEPLALAKGEKLEKTFEYRLEDPDPRAYVYWVQAKVTAKTGECLVSQETRLYRYRPYDLTEQICIATWHTDEALRRRAYADVFLRHLSELGFNAVMPPPDVEAAERRNFRLYGEHQASTTLGIGHPASFAAPVEGYAERYQKEGAERAAPSSKGKRAWPTAALNLFSMGEESGYGPWSEAYPWRDKEEAPEECGKWFRHYLQTLYKDLGTLNRAWGKEFKDWSEVKVWRKYAKPFGWMFAPPPDDPEPNLTPYVDTHAFHEWHFREYCRNYMTGFNRANPVPTWTLSYDFTFIQVCPAPVTNFYAALGPEGVSLWHAYIRSRTAGPANPFHLDWMFYEDEPMNNQFLQMGLALGCTYLSTWGHVFNADLQPTRPGMAVAKTLRALERPEAVVRTMRPRYDKRIGIFTFDSRWFLVRGRYGYYLQRQGPDDISCGLGPLKPPGASYVRPCEGPLYTALAASGYSPAYVKADQFDQCRVLFVPYVEAMDAEAAARLQAYVRGGGTLVVFPMLAQYDEGGKPYPKHPGAGLDALVGFTATPKWIMGRYPVDFPGENAAKKAFADTWFQTSGALRTKEAEAKAMEAPPPLAFAFCMRHGGDPNHYCPEGHLALEDLAKDVVPVGRHEDGQPLFTYRKVGQGEAIVFNVFLTWGSGTAVPWTDQDETFREVIDQLVRRRGIQPDFEFRNLRAYGEGIGDFVTCQYDLPGTDTRILSLFSDWRAKRADARLILRKPFREVWDVFAGERLVSLPGADGSPESVVAVEPARWRLLALSPAVDEAPALIAPAPASPGQVAEVRLDAQGTAYGRLEVLGPDGKLLPHHSRSIVLSPGDPLRLRLRLDDPAGRWTVRYVDAVTGRTTETRLSVRQGPLVPRPAEERLESARLAEQGPAVTDGEFLGLLERLRARHLDPEPTDKRRYSYYTEELEEGRHRTCQLLACVDWTERAEALAGYVASGQRVYLVGEDLGWDPDSGVCTTPARRPRILEALDGLVARKRAELLQVSGRPHLRVLRTGKGFVVLDRRSPDAAGNSNLHLAQFQARWRQEMEAVGLLPGGKGTSFLPVGKETVEQWFFGGRTATQGPRPPE